MSERKSTDETSAANEERTRRLDPGLIERIDADWKRWRQIFPPLDMPRGVHKFRSIEEMSAYREKYENERIARLRERLKEAVKQAMKAAITRHAC
jgi:hypothetical protein